MTRYIFHGGGFGKDSAKDDSFYAELMKDVPYNGTVLLVYFASRTEINTEKIAYDTQKCLAFSHGTSPSIAIASTKDFVAQATEADVIYFRGGSTQKLLEALHQYPNLKPAFENKHKTVAGSSAGAYALSMLYSSHYDDVIEAGLAIVPVRVITHYQSENMSPKQGAIEMLRGSHHDLKLITLREGEWEVIVQ